MNDQYFPVLKAKKGELDALSNLSQSVLARTTPIIELTKLGGRQLEAAQKRTDTPSKIILKSAQPKLRKQFLKQLMLDIFQWPENFLIESGEHILNYAIDQLTEKGILPCPLIGYDRWETPEYKEAIKSIRLGKDQFSAFAWIA